MLDTTTKRRIDSARDILVGKVPDPKSQVEQITIALIYKFMDDMDAEAEELGGHRSFFQGDFRKYAWSNIFDPRMGGFELLETYSEAILKMNTNPNIPQLFRNIFKNAYLPYRDPETLKSFLKIINEFEYDHSERLGDAFEYLLSILGSQGDAGQFRTPRHIIDFMVDIIDPKKNESILDPACGTAGFLISSFKHILKKNSSNYDPSQDKRTFEMNDVSLSELTINGKKYKGDLLTMDEWSLLSENIKGYDISPDMVRLSLVNMYLHGLQQPIIQEYDTLTSEEKWNEYSDVILANPPFMSPKGGIRPHKRFSVQSNRSEVLFVNYMAEHLTPTGKAAIIVPEGIIFQTGKAYKSLRKMLVDDYLVGVISLPAGVFQPYSGVKTSILWLDKALAKKTNNILFVKIENDGFDLGAQRRPIKLNDLPQASENIAAYKRSLLGGAVPEFGEFSNIQVVNRNKIGEIGDYNLKCERYQVKPNILNSFEWYNIKDLVMTISDGDWIESKDQSESGIRLIQTGNIGKGEFKEKEGKARFISSETFERLNCTEVYPNDVLVSRLPDPVGRACLAPISNTRMIASVDCSIIRFNTTKILPKIFVFYTKNDHYYESLKQFLTGASRERISRKNLEKIQIPLPPLSIQEEIVAEIESYQRIIDGARQVVENFKPRIEIDPDWEMVKLGKVCEFVRGPFGGSLKKEIFLDDGIAVYEQSHAIQNQFNSIRYFISEKKFEEMKRFQIFPGDIIMSCSGTMGKVAIVPTEAKKGIINQALLKLTVNDRIENQFLKMWMESENFQDSLKSNVYGAAIQNVASVKVLQDLNIPLPSVEDQRNIIGVMKKEQELVDANKHLIEIYEQKIKDRIAKVWEE